MSYAELPKGPMPAGLLDLVPELCIELKSPSETWTATFSKVVEYLNAGVLMVVVPDPETSSASVYCADARQEIPEASANLEMPDLFPGLSIPLAKLFD